MLSPVSFLRERDFFMRSAVVIEALRTPIGRAHPEKGCFRDVRADDLSAELIKGVLAKTKLPASAVEDVQWGCVKQQDEQGFNIGRMASLIAGLPVETGACTVNRLCGSSLQAVHQAAMSIAAGCEDVQIAGGIEHMQHIPMEIGFDPSPRLYYHHSPATMNMGLTAENLALRYKISRREQDEFSLRSHQRAAVATDTGAFAREILPVWGRDDEGIKRLIPTDQGIRRDTSLEALSALKPAFVPEGGTVTAGNSSQVSVGAAALLVMSEERAKQLGLQPLVRIRAMAVAGVDPSVMGIGPVPATLKALERAKLSLADIDLIEVNEAFAAQILAVLKLLKANPEKVNIRGGAVALGHPLGASGARIATTLIHAMRDQKAKLGLATMCIGAGQGIATIFEAV
jgi:acetyl-CoA acyltransferase